MLRFFGGSEACVSLRLIRCIKRGDQRLGGVDAKGCRTETGGVVSRDRSDLSELLGFVHYHILKVAEAEGERNI